MLLRFLSIVLTMASMAAPVLAAGEHFAKTFAMVYTTADFSKACKGVFGQGARVADYADFGTIGDVSNWGQDATFITFNGAYADATTGCDYYIEKGGVLSLDEDPDPGIGCQSKTLPILCVVPPTAPPTPAPKPTVTASGSGDPHFTTFGGEKYDFHGGCDLVLIDNPSFANGLGLRIHIRTKISSWWSHIATAVVSIGGHTLEVTGGMDGGKFWFNSELQDSGSLLALSGFPVEVHQITSPQRRYRIDLGDGDAISMETYKRFVRVDLKAKTQEKFQGALGLMGSYPEGLKVARDGSVVVTDPNEFGQEWQVQASEPMLFHEVAGVQHPQACVMPDETERSATKKRRLGESLISEEEAAVACALVQRKDEREACVFDVLATNDKDMAGAY